MSIFAVFCVIVNMYLIDLLQTPVQQWKTNKRREAGSAQDRFY